MAGAADGLEVRRAREEDVAGFMDAFVRSLWVQPPARPGIREEWLARTGTDGMRVAVRGDEVLGGLVLLPLGQWFGGRCVSMTGISAVSVAPEHRAQGVARALMGASLEELRAEGVALSALYPATRAVYRKHGFECAGLRFHYRAPTQAFAAAARGPDATCTVRRLGHDEVEIARDLHRERARTAPGMIDRSAWAWRRILDPLDVTAEAYLVERDGRPEGHVVLHREREVPFGYEQHLRDVVALTPAALRAIAGLVGGSRSVSKGTLWHGGPADPLAFLLLEEEARIEHRWEWMLRLVDVERAIAERGFHSQLDVELDLTLDDEHLAANAGCWMLRIRDGRGHLERGGRGGSLRASVRGLAAVYSGHVTAEAAARAGLMGGRDEDLAQLSACFAGAAPWLSDMF